MSVAGTTRRWQTRRRKWWVDKGVSVEGKKSNAGPKADGANSFGEAQRGAVRQAASMLDACGWF